MVVCLSILAQAQVKIYEYPSGNLTEERISEILVQSQQNNVSAEELGTLNKLLHKKMHKQQQDYLLGNNQKGINPIVNSSSCVNPGFENNSNSNWNFASGDINSVSLPCNTCPTPSVAINNVVNSSSTITGQCSGGIDKYGSFPVVAPGSSYSLLLNDASAGGKIMEANYSFVVTASSNIYTFQYAAVLNSGGTSHGPTTQPYFHVDVTDNTVGSPIACTQYDVAAPNSGALPGWTISPLQGGNALSTVYYRGWTTVSLDLTSLINHTLTVSYIISDCAQGGHFGYVYIDGDCGQINTTNNNVGICNGSNANLCGPPGYTGYSWTGPNTGSSQCLSTPTVGNYTLNMVSSTSCPAPQLTYSVTASPAPTASMSIATTPCSFAITGTDQSTVSSGTITNWDWNWGDGQTSTSTTSGNTQAHTYTANGNYTVVMTCTTAAGCAGTYSVAVSLNGSLATPVITTSVSCNGGTTGSATITPTGGSGVYTYTWSPSGGSNSVATGLGAGTYTCAVSDGAGCNNTATATIGQPTALNSTSSIVQTTCNQFNGSATIAMSGGIGPYTYTWSPAGGNTITIAGVAAGTYTCNVTDANNCSYTTPVTITNKPLPAIISFSTTNVSCYSGTNGSVTVTATGTGLNYSWSPSGGNTATASGLSNGVYTVTVTDINNCVVTGIDTIIQPTDIVATSSVSPSSCSIPNGSATVTVTGGTGAYTYTWTPSGGATNIASGIGANSYSCTIKDGNNCTKVVSVFITTTTGPTVSVVGSSSVTCNGGTNGTATITAAGGTGSLTYTWAPVGGNDTTANGLSSGTYTCVVMDSLGCLRTASVTINQPTILSTPVVTTSVSCNGGTNGAATINTSGGTGPYTYTWVPSTITSTTNIASNLGVGTYTCNILDAHNCPTFTTAVISQPLAISASVTTTSVSCHGGNDGTATASTSGGIGPYQYAWAPFGGSNAPAINLTVGTYTVLITDVHTNPSCPLTTTVTVVEPTAITATVTSTNILCHGDHNGSATVNAIGGIGVLSYSWSPSSGLSSTTLPTLTAGSHTSTVKDANGCFTKTTFTITEPPIITITSIVTPVKCSGASNGSASVNITGGVPGYTVNWSTNPVQTGTNATGLSLNSYTATVIDANGCSKKKAVVISSPEPNDTLDITGTLCSTDPNVILTAPNGNGISSPYQWYNNATPITGATSSNYAAFQSILHDYSVTWFYNGCVYITTTILETIQADLSTYPQTNIFTPNADKINDEFYPFALHSSSVARVNAMLKEYELFVYDRWGTLMYSSNQYAEPWDGKHAGKDLPDGTYYWIVNYKTNCNNNNGLQKIKGFVQLLK